MDVTGIWKIAKILTFDEDFKQVWKTTEEILSSPETDKDTKMLLNADYEFGEDGVIKVKAPLPEGITQEEIDEAVAEGEIELCGEGRFIVESYEWKFEGDQLMFKTNIHGEVLGEELSPWEKIEQTDDGMLQMLVYVLKRA